MLNKLAFTFARKGCASCAVLRARLSPHGRFFAALLCSIVVACGCGTVRPEADYKKAAGLIKTHSGIEGVYDPATDSVVEQKVADLLKDGLTVEKAAQIALINNRAFQSLFLEIGVSRADVVQSRLFTNPSISFLPRFPDIGGRSDLTAGFTQEVADLWQIPVRKKIALAQLESTVLKVADFAINLLAQTKSLYYRLVMLQEGEKITRENVALVEQSSQLAQHRFDAGEATILDLNLVKSELVAARMRLSTLQRDGRTTRAEFAKILSLAGSTTEWTPVDPLFRATLDIPDDTALFDLAETQRLDAQIALLDMKAAEKELIKQCRSVFPSFVLGAEMERTERKSPPSRFTRGMAAWDHSKGSQPTFPTPRQDKLDASQIVNYLVGPSFQLTLPLWDQNRAQIARARMVVKQNRKNHEEIVQSIRADVEKAAAAARCTAELLRAYAEEALPQAQKNHATARRVYEAGEDSILVLLQAQKTLIDVRDGYNQALGDYALALVELERAVGGRLVPQGKQAEHNQ